MAPFLTVQFGAFWRPWIHSYHPVPVPDEEILLVSPGRRATGTSRSNKPAFDPSFWLTAFAILSIAITAWDLYVVSRKSHVSYLEVSVGSPYNGLEKLLRDESSPSWPLSSTYYPDFIGATGGKGVHHSLSEGSTVRLDSERTIVIQHRVRDYGLEHCAIRLEFSSLSEKGHEHTKQAYGKIGEGHHLALWRLEDSGSKIVPALSALPTSLPPREEFIGNITLDVIPPVQSPSFRCSGGSIQTVEIAVACISDPCAIEFRLSRSPRRQGFWVVQSEQEILV